MKSAILVPLLGVLILSSCAAARRQDEMNELQKSVEAYNHAFRWKNYERAASFLPPTLRGAFIATHEDDTKSLHVEDFKVLQVDLPSKDSAVIVVSYRYTLLPSVTVENRKVTQSWHRVAGTWILETEADSIREIKVDKKLKNPEAFGGLGGDEEGTAEVEVTGPDGKVLTDAKVDAPAAPEGEEAAPAAAPKDEPK